MQFFTLDKDGNTASERGGIMAITEFIVGANLLMGAVGAGAAAKGQSDRNKANTDRAELQQRSKENHKALDAHNLLCMKDMDRLLRKELHILSSFKQFSNLMDKLQNRPVFDEICKADIVLPRYDEEVFKSVAVNAGMLLNGLSGAALGAAGGMAATGAVTAATIAMGTASTGVPIISLNGVAMAKATLATLGGGSLAAGGGGVAMGGAVLNGTMVGAGMLVGGLYYAITGSTLSAKVEEARLQVEEEERKIKEICDYLLELQSTANRYGYKLDEVNRIYQTHLQKLDRLVNVRKRTAWKQLTAEEISIAENTTLLVQLLYSMCKLELIQQNGDPEGMNEIRSGEVVKTIQGAKQVIQEMNMNY